MIRRRKRKSYLSDLCVLRLFLLFGYRDNDVVNDPAVKQVVVEQTKQWSEMMERHRKENWELMRDHLKAQEDVLRELMKAQQKMQIKELENFFEKYVMKCCIFP